MLDINVSEALVGAMRSMLRRGGFYDFVQAYWSVLEPDPLITGWAMELICRELERVYRGETQDLLINVPPGFSKSTITCAFFPAWVWSLNPTKKWIASSHDPALVLRDAQRTKQLVESPLYENVFSTRLVKDKRRRTDAAGLYYTTDGGYRLSSAIGSRGVGFHCHYHIIDDPHKPLDTSADSGIAMDKAWLWLGLMGTRAQPGQRHARIVIMQRLHEHDMSGRILRQEDSTWRHVCLPMHGDRSRSDRHEDDQRADGELLCPELKDTLQVTRERRALLEAGADVEAQHEQRPVPPGGKVFKHEWIQYWSVLPYSVVYYQSWDFTFGASRTSYVVGQVWATDGTCHYLVDQYREQTDYPGMKRMMRTAQENYPQTATIYSEGAALGKAINQELVGEFPNIEEVSVSGVGGKLVRARSITGEFSDGTVFFPNPDRNEIDGRIRRSMWVGGTIGRLLKFTGAAADIADEIDCISQYLSRHRGRRGLELLAGVRR